jgi:hypothetical protein
MGVATIIRLVLEIVARILSAVRDERVREFERLRIEKKARDRDELDAQRAREIDAAIGAMSIDDIKRMQPHRRD